MNHMEQISARQYMILVVLFTVGTTILVTPSGLAAEAKQDAWITVLLGMAEGALLLLLYTALSMRFPRQTLVEICLELLGKRLGTIAAVWFASFGFIAAATVIWGVSNFVTTELLVETPLKAVNILFGAIVVIGVRVGIETLSRSAELAFPIVVALFFVLVVFSAPLIDFDNIRPVLETGIKPHLKASLSYTSFSNLPLIVFLMIFPSSLAADPGKAKKAFWTAALVGGASMTLIVMLDILVLGADIAAHTTYVTFLLAGKIRVFDFLQRFEAIVAGIWLTGMFYKTCIYFYSSVYGLAQTFNLSFRPLVIPIGLVLIAATHHIYPSIVYAHTWDELTWVPYTIMHGLVMPLVLLLIAAWRKRR